MSKIQLADIDDVRQALMPEVRAALADEMKKQLPEVAELRRLIACFKPVLSSAEACAYCGVSDDTLSNWRKAGLKYRESVPGIRGFAYRRADLDAWLEGGSS